MWYIKQNFPESTKHELQMTIMELLEISNSFSLIGLITDQPNILGIVDEIQICTRPLRDKHDACLVKEMIHGFCF